MRFTTRLPTRLLKLSRSRNAFIGIIEIAAQPFEGKAIERLRQITMTSTIAITHRRPVWHRNSVRPQGDPHSRTAHRSQVESKTWPRLIVVSVELCMSKSWIATHHSNVRSARTQFGQLFRSVSTSAFSALRKPMQPHCLLFKSKETDTGKKKRLRGNMRLHGNADNCAIDKSFSVVGDMLNACSRRRTSIW